jgi:hypothetical protein
MLITSNTNSPVADETVTEGEMEVPSAELKVPKGVF